MRVVFIPPWLGCSGALSALNSHPQPKASKPLRPTVQTQPGSEYRIMPSFLGRGSSFGEICRGRGITTELRPLVLRTTAQIIQNIDCVVPDLVVSLRELSDPSSECQINMGGGGEGARTPFNPWLGAFDSQLGPCLVELHEQVPGRSIVYNPKIFGVMLFRIRDWSSGFAALKH